MSSQLFDGNRLNCQWSQTQSCSDTREYAPIRISPDEQCDRINDGIMKMSNLQIENVVKSVVNGIKKYTNSQSTVKYKARLQNEGMQQEEPCCPVHGQPGHTHSPMSMTQPIPSGPSQTQLTQASQSQFGTLPPFMQNKKGDK